MFLLILSLFFCWLIYREFKNPKVAVIGFNNFDRIYIAVLICLAVASAWHPVKVWRFERFLSEKASELAGRPADVHCNTAFDDIFDHEIRRAGYALIDKGEIVFQYGWCAHLMEYLDHPESVSIKELWSLTLFTHEVMHIRGERDEQKTECQAVQRNYRAAKLLGIADNIARQSAIAYFDGPYKTHAYYTNKCGPGKEYDEKLPDSIWLSGK